MPNEADEVHGDSAGAAVPSVEAGGVGAPGDRWAVVARLVRPHGRRGELIAEILTDFPERFRERSRLFLLPPGRPEGSGRAVALESFRLQRERVVLKFRGIDSINDAEKLRGLDVAIPASERAPLEAGSVYVSDLVGCRVFDLNRGGIEVGEILDVDRGLSNADLLVIRRPGMGGAGAEALIPFVQEYLATVDTAGRRLEMRLPEGLLEINAPMSEEEKRQFRAANEEPEA